ncbi:MAG: hypothetical protein ACR2HE_04725 [Casimicrobiaceae bacterium]
MLARAKSNVSPDTGGFGYDLDHRPLDGFPGVSASRVLWGAAIDGTARELLAQAEQDPNEEARSELDEAKTFLSALLKDGPVASRQVKADADGAGFSWRTIQRAQAALKIDARKQGLRGGWVWELPPKNAKNSQESQQNLLATFGNVGVLRENLDAPKVNGGPAKSAGEEI